MSADRLAGSFGGKLRDARERRGVSLRQIANATKISVAALEALERNDISRLPGGIFSRAFVRSYAIEVGLDPEATIQEFIAQFPNDSVTAGHPASDRGEDHEAVESDRQTAGVYLWLVVVSVPLAAALLYFTASGREAARKPPQASATPATPAADPAPTTPAADPSPSTPAAKSPAPEPAPADPPPSAPAAAPPVAAVPPAASAAAPADRLTIALSVKRPVWVSATVDGQKAIERLLQPGEQQTVNVRREMVLTAGDASAIAMTLNGAEARPLGKAGEVVTARFNLTNFKTYLQTQNR
jgi:cytoskeletal protein RodZ